MDVIVIWYHTDIRAKFHGVTHGLIVKGVRSCAVVVAYDYAHTNPDL